MSFQDVRHLEEEMAKVLQLKKQDNENKKKEYERVCNQSEEINELKKLISTAYANKERTAQIQDAQMRKLYEKVSFNMNPIIINRKSSQNWREML